MRTHSAQNMSGADRFVGIMADSHGRADSIKAGLQLLQENGCRRIYHLGDIGDSALPGVTDACVSILVKSGVKAIKGNNDHTLVVNARSNGNPPVSSASLDYLEGLPMTRRWRDAFLAHSLPLERELGLSCMVRTPENYDLRPFFSKYPDSVLFRGHSHDPEIATVTPGKTIKTTLAAGTKLEMVDHLPCIVTCGALTRGHCMIWDPDARILKCLLFNI